MFGLQTINEDFQEMSGLQAAAGLMNESQANSHHNHNSSIVMNHSAFSGAIPPSAGQHR